MFMKLLNYLFIGIIVGVPAGIISSIILIPMYMLIQNVQALAALGILGAAVGLIVLGWWVTFAKHKGWIR